MAAKRWNHQLDIHTTYINSIMSLQLAEGLSQESHQIDWM